MAKTGKQIQTDLYNLLKDSTLYTLINGDVYRAGLRPRDSRKEDAVVFFITGDPSEIETGFVCVNIYVPDIDPYDNGVLVEDGERCEEVEALAQNWVDSLTCEISNYRFKLAETISTIEDLEARQHFVHVRLRYWHYGDPDAPLVLPQSAQIDAIDVGRNDDYYPLLQTEDGDDLIIDPILTK